MAMAWGILVGEGRAKSEEDNGQPGSRPVRSFRTRNLSIPLS